MNLEPSILISINKRAFDRIFNNDKAKLAEIRIRLIGNDIEMQHVINHPSGNKLFFEFLKKELATENIQFVNAVMRYDDMCDRLKKEMYKIQSQHAQYAAELRAMKQLNQRSPGGAGGTRNGNGDDEDDHHLSNRRGGGSAASLLDQSGTMNPNNEQSRTLQRSNSYSTHLSSDKSDMPFSIVDYVELVERGIIKRQPSGSGVVIKQQGQQPPAMSNNTMIADPIENNQVTAFTGVQPTSTQSPDDGEDNNTVAMKVVDYYGNDENSVANQSTFSASIATKKLANAEDLSLRSRSIMNNSSAVDPPLKTNSEGNATVLSNNTTASTSSSPEEGNPTDVMLASSTAIVGTSTNSLQSSNGSGRYKISVPTSGPMRRTSFKSNLELGQNATAGAANTSGVFSHNHDASSAASPTAVLDAAPADFATLVISQYHKLEKNILELKEVAKNIMEKFIMKGAESEVNIPEKLRIETEERFKAWYSLSINACLRKLQQNVTHNPKIFQNATSNNNNHVGSNQAQQHTHHHRNTSNNAQAANSSSSGAGNQQTATLSPNAPNQHSNSEVDFADTPYRSDSIEFQHMSNGTLLSSDDEDFANIFKSAKQEIFKLLQNDPFIRWKQTTEFKNFITAIKPYENNENSYHGSAHISTFRRNSFQRVSGGHHGSGHPPPARPYRSLLASSSSSSAANLTSTHTHNNGDQSPKSYQHMHTPDPITEEANYNDHITKLSFQVLANQSKDSHLTRVNSASAAAFTKQPSILEDQQEGNAGKPSSTTQTTQASKKGFFSSGSKNPGAVAISG